MIVKIFDRNEEYRVETEVFNFRHLHEINRLDVLTGYTLEPIDKGEKILYQHKTGKWYEFIVDAPEIIHEEGVQYHFTAINSLVEIDGDWIEDKRPSTLSAAVVSILEPTRWTMGNVTNKPNIGLTFYRVTAREALDILLENYPVEFQTRIEVGTSGVVTRTLDVLDRIGGDYGKRFVYNRDLTSVKRTYRQGKVVTALYGFGKGEEVGDGFGRRIDFSSVNNGYPYVYNPAILAEYGRLENGVRKHVFDRVVYDDVDDKNKLLQLTQDEYAKRCRPQVSYEGTVVDLGLEHEQVGIGDTVKVIDGDHRFETRINYLMENEYFQNEVRLANYIMNITDSNRSLIKKVGELATNAGVWDEAQKIADGSYMDDLVDKLNDQANASGGWTFIKEGEGLLTINAPTEDVATKAVNIVGGTVRVASQKNSNGSWKWRTFITGDRAAADMISTGILQGGMVHWNLDTGVLYIGDTPETASLYWDGSNLKLNVSELKINSKDVATKADLTLTSENLTAKFSQIGGENLFKDSEDLSSWVLYQGATMVSGYPLQESVPEWSTDEAWRVRTTSLGSSDIKAYINISSDLAKLRSRPFTFSVYAKNNRTDASVRIGTNRFGSEILAPSEMKRIIISGENDNDLFMQLQLSAQTANHYLDVTLYHPKFETGWIATDWNDYLYTGITRIDKDGGHFGREGETIETGIAFDGVRIEDGGKELASFIASGSVISDLQVVGTITGNVINSIDESLTFNVGSGDGYYANISEVMRAIGNRKYLKYGTKLTINIYGTLNETMIIDGFSGGGEVEINLYEKINGYIRTVSNSCLVKVYGKNNTQVVSGNGNTVISSGDSYTLFNGLNVDSKNPSSGIGIMSQNGSNVYVENCDFINTNDALYAMSGGKLQALNNKGNPTRFACMASSGRIWARGTVPDGGNYGFVYNFDELTRTPSAFSPPPTTTTDETLVFNHTDIYTYSVKYGARSTHYGKAAAQNRWDTSMTQMKGRISFGTSVYNFIAGRDSGTTPTVKMRLRRQNSTHGASASVAPTPEWSGAPSFGGATRGNWTPWVTIPYTLFASSGYTFSFYDGSTGNSYAIWDYAQVQITRTITQ